MQKNISMRLCPDKTSQLVQGLVHVKYAVVQCCPPRKRLYTVKFCYCVLIASNEGISSPFPQYKERLTLSIQPASLANVTPTLLYLSTASCLYSFPTSQKQTGAIVASAWMQRCHQFTGTQAKRGVVRFSFQISTRN